MEEKNLYHDELYLDIDLTGNSCIPCPTGCEECTFSNMEYVCTECPVGEVL